MRNRTLKICAMLLAICTSTIHMQAMDEWDGVTQAKGFYSGTGTKTDPYRIFTASQFLYFIQQTKDGNTFSGQYVELCNDIAFKTNEGLVEGGDFYGNFDGNDHTIKVYEWTAEAFWVDYIANGWHLFNLYGSMHDVHFVNANEVMTICTDGILYNCGFDFNNSFNRGDYHGNATVFLKGGTIANCVSNDAYYTQGLEQGRSQGFVHENVDWMGTKKAYGNCLNCYFPIKSYWYGGNRLQGNYYGSNIESCGEDAGNDWVLNHTEYDYKSWPLTFSPIYPEYLIQEQPQTYNPLVVYPHSDEALYQWCYQECMPITFEDITFSYSTQTKNIVVPGNDGVLSFDFKADGYTYTGYNDGTDDPAWISINGEKIVNVYKEIEGSYSCPISAGTYEISCARTEISNIRFAYPTDTIENETSSVLSKQTIMDKPGAYFCQVSYGEGCDVMYSDYVDYEKLLTIDNVTYVVNEDSTATVLWVADMAVDITILKRVKYNDVNYPVTSISSKAFVDCTSLESIKCNMLDAPTLLGGTTFEELTGVLIPSNVTLYVPIGSESVYSAAEGWKEFSSIIGVEIIVELVDGQVYDNNNDKVMGEINYTRTFNNTEWQALYVPFAMSYDDWKEDFDVAKINDIHQFDVNNDGDFDDAEDKTIMEMLKVNNGTLKANHPYMIRAKSTGTKTITVENATLMPAESNSIDCSSVERKYVFTGTYNTIDGETMVNNKYYAMSGGGVKYTTSTSVSLKPFRWYMQIMDRDGQLLESAAEIKVVVSGEDDWDVTGIESVKDGDGTFKVYSIGGVLVRSVKAADIKQATEGLPKGLYIINGKKCNVR